MANPIVVVDQTVTEITKYMCPDCDADGDPIELRRTSLVALPFGQTRPEKEVLKEERVNDVKTKRFYIHTPILVCDTCYYCYVVKLKRDVNLKALMA